MTISLALSRPAVWHGARCRPLFINHASRRAARGIRGICQMALHNLSNKAPPVRREREREHSKNFPPRGNKCGRGRLKTIAKGVRAKSFVPVVAEGGSARQCSGTEPEVCQTPKLLAMKFLETLQRRAALFSHGWTKLGRRRAVAI